MCRGVVANSAYVGLAQMAQDGQYALLQEELQARTGPSPPTVHRVGLLQQDLDHVVEVLRYALALHVIW